MDYRAMGLRIRKARQRMNITQVDLARELSVSREHLAGVERGLIVPDFDFLCAISLRLSASLDHIIAGVAPAKNVHERAINDIVAVLEEHRLWQD